VLRRAATTALTVLTLALVTGTTVEARGNDVGRGLCLAVTQGVTKIKGTSCKQAKKVLRLYYRADLPKRPECRGQGSIRFRGLKVTGVGRAGEGIATRFARPGRSFWAVGGGTC
jgi:hypothetical protein